MHRQRQRRSVGLRRARSLLFLGSLSLLAVRTSPSAQEAYLFGGSPYAEAWVDPCSGNDISGAVGAQDRPFKTIFQAKLRLKQLFPTPSAPGLIHCNPGIYGPMDAAGVGNDEPFPIQMADNIHIQGLGARQCIVRGLQGPSTLEPWYPLDSHQGNSRLQKEILLDLGFLWDDSYEEKFDGFTFQGGHVQVYAETEGVHIAARISNCVFDMLDMSDVGIAGPDFGVLMVHTYDSGSDPFYGGVPPDPPLYASETVLEDGYWDIYLHLFNNTFVQGWEDASTGVFRAKLESVAICDVANTLDNDPHFLFPLPDPNAQYRGVGNPNVQNNLIRYVTDDYHTAMLGIDDGDVRAQVGSKIGPTNAFDPDEASQPTNGTYRSHVVGSSPTPALIPAGNANGDPFANPAFVGEFLSAGLGRPTEVARDWRILPDSALVDQGSYPLNNAVLQADNGLVYDQTGRPFPDWSFVFDGEGYGNLRIQGASVDIGFDESDILIVAGGFTNDSNAQAGLTDCGLGFFCVPEPHCPNGMCGSTSVLDHVEIYPAAGRGYLFSSWYDASLIQLLPPLAPTAPGYFWAASIPWSLLLVPQPFLPSNIHPSYPASALWLFNVATTGHYQYRWQSIPAMTWTTPDDGVVHGFGMITDPIFRPDTTVVPPDACDYVNHQASFIPDANPSVIGFSNAQSLYE